jgi:hypothetical protein
MLKRERERARIEKQKQKAARRAEKAQRPSDSHSASDDVDRDIAHIVPGPQPPAEWQVDEAAANDSDDEEEKDGTT